jgi:hypothetical protein
MKGPAKRLNNQMNLPLLKAQATVVPDHKQNELALTLMELLISAAREKRSEPTATGGGDEPPEAHR